MYQIITIGGEIIISDEIYKDLQKNLERFYEGEFRHGGILYQEVSPNRNPGTTRQRMRPMWHYPEAKISIFLDQICSIMPIELEEKKKS